MNILVATVYPATGGGLSSHVADLVSSLGRLGHRVRRIGYEEIRPGRLSAGLCWAASLGRMDDARRRFAALRLRNLTAAIDAACAAERFDLVHCHDPLAGCAAGRGVHSARVPRVQTIHGPLVFESQMGTDMEAGRSGHLAALEAIERDSFHSAGRLIAVDTGQAGIARTKYGVDPAGIDIIFNAVLCDEVERLSLDPPAAAVEPPYVLAPRRLVAKNGVDVAVRAMAQLADIPRLRLVSVGGGPERAALDALVGELGIRDRVVFLGRQEREEVLRLGRRALAVVVPSKPASGVVEATSIAAIEAMACGTPLIVSAIGGLAELVKPGLNGLSVPAEDPAALAAAIRRIAGDEALRGQLAARGREYARTHLDVGVWVRRILAVYEKVLDGASKGGRVAAS